MNFTELIKTGRSVRAYTGQAPTKAELEEILKAGTYAPSGSNRQMSVAVCITDPKTIAAIGRLNAAVMGRKDTDPFYGAPVLIVVFDRRENGTRIMDGSAVILTMLYKAHDMGIDGCWIHRAKETFETEEGRELMRSFGLDPDEYEGIDNVILGHHAGSYPADKPRREGRILWAD